MAPIERWEVVKREGYWIRDRVTGVERETGNGRAWAKDCARVANAKEDEYMRAELDATREEAFEEVDRLVDELNIETIAVFFDEDECKDHWTVEGDMTGGGDTFTEALKAAANPNPSAPSGERGKVLAEAFRDIASIPKEAG